MGRRLAWAVLVLTIVVVGVAAYETLHSSAHRAGEMTMTGRK